MEPIISPWLMYILAITQALNTLALACLFFAGIVSWLSLGEDSLNLPKRGWIFIGIVVFISLLIFIFVPNRQEMIAIIASSSITPENFPMDMQEYITNLVKVCGAVK